MDFFTHQERARRRTAVLVLVFAVAVAAILAAIYLVASVTILGFGDEATLYELAAADRLWDPRRFAAVAALTLAVIGGGSLFKTATLARGGGERVARLLGGRPLVRTRAAGDEARLLNVVEEMAIASGLPVPPVYLLGDEEGINAFAAGLSRQEAVIGVTRGGIRLLERDELQGVIGHELSHVANGDMRLNLRLIGVLHGLLLVSLIGSWLMRSGRGSSGSRGRKRGGHIALFGLALYGIGYVGLFCGKIIKGSISRQREFLADAAAVQFTRDPDGIAGALKKIGGLGAGSRLEVSTAEQASHLYFANGVGGAFARWMRTHPPLAERVRRIEPSFDGEFPVVREPETAGGRARRGEGAAERAGTGGLSVPAAVVAAVGRPGAVQVARAREILEELPQVLVRATREPVSARTVVVGMLLASEGDRERQATLLERHGDELLRRELDDLLPEIERLDRKHRLPLVELALPALVELSREQYRRLRVLVEGLSHADGVVTLFEYALERVVVARLDPVFGAPRPRVRFYGLARLWSECSVLLSAIVRAGQERREDRRRAFAAAASELGPGAPKVELLSEDEVTFERLDGALGTLATVSAPRKREVVAACAAAVAVDDRLEVAEAELLRAVCAVLDCPLPPLEA